MKKAPVFETYAVTDNTEKDPVTGAPIPSDIEIGAAKRWVEENEL